MPLFGPGDPNPMGMQLWIDLPKEHKMTVSTSFRAPCPLMFVTKPLLVGTNISRTQPFSVSLLSPARLSRYSVYPLRIPSAFPEGPDGPIEVKVISGKSFGAESPVKHLGGCWYMDFQFKASDVTVFQDLRKF